MQYHHIQSFRILFVSIIFFRRGNGFLSEFHPTGWVGRARERERDVPDLPMIDCHGGGDVETRTVPLEHEQC